MRNLQRGLLLAAAGLAFAAAAAGCADGDPRFEEAWSSLPPVALDQVAAYVERGTATVFLLDPADPKLRPHTVALAKDPALAVRRNGHDELLVLSRGEPGKPGVKSEPAELTLIPGAPGKHDQVRRYRLATSFTSLVQSSDGRFVIAFFGPGTKAGSGILFNPNEIAIVDLAASPQAVPVARTVRSFGGVPLNIVFSPELNLPEGKRTLAVVLSDNYVTLLDLDNPRRPEITVPLTLGTDNRMRRPVQVLFETRDKEPAAYVRAEGAQDIYVLRLSPATDRETTTNDFIPSLSQLTAGAQPLDMALIGEANDPRLLVLMATGDAWLFDALTSRATRISLAELGVTTAEPAPNRIYLFEAQGPGDPRSRPRALLLGQGNARRSVTFLELERLEEQRSKNLDLRPMGAPAQNVHFFPQQGIALVQHAQVPGGAGGAGFSVIDLARRTVAPIFASVSVERITLGTAPGGAAMKPGKVWIAPASGGGELDSHLGFLDLGSFSPGDVRLDARVGQILPLGSGSDGKRRVLVDHGLVAGHVTVIDADDPKRATARTVSGFMLNDLLQRGAR